MNWLRGVLTSIGCLALVIGTAVPALSPSRTSKADPEQIEELIYQLGSKSFAQRQAATKALDAISQPALAALREAAAHSDDAEIRRRARILVRKIENRLDQLLLDYRAYRLPFPRKNFRLVRFKDEDQFKDDGDPLPPAYGLAFSLQRAAREKGPVLMRGTLKYTPPEHPAVKIVPIGRPTAKDIERYARESKPLGEDGLVLAIQCKARGWDRWAEALFQKSLTDNPHQLPQETLARIAWNHTQEELTDPRADWKVTARRLRKLMKADQTFDTNENQSMLKSLEAALVPSKAKPGTVAARIDDLIYVTSTHLYTYGHMRPDRQYLRVVELGFAAIPELIDHLEDNRLTRTLSFTGCRHCEVGHVISDLLHGLAAGDLRELRHQVDRDEAAAWWKKTRKMDEKAYLLAHVLPADKMWPNPTILHILRKKYPQNLAGIYRTLLDKHPESRSWPVVRAIRDSSLPAAKQKELFLQGARHKSLKHRRAALEGLKDVDGKRFVQLLIENLEGLPHTPSERYGDCDEPTLTHLVKQTDDPRVWETLAKVAQRCDVGLRLQLMEPLTEAPAGKRQRQRRLAFLARFLDDAAVRDIKADPDLYRGGYAAIDFPRIEVRDFAAMALASLLDIAVKPNKDWTPERWARLRAQVRKALGRSP
jgi:hypothetical protein